MNPTSDLAITLHLLFPAAQFQPWPWWVPPLATPQVDWTAVTNATTTVLLRMPSKYDHLSSEELVALLAKRDASQNLGLVWERDELEHEKEGRHFQMMPSGIARTGGPIATTLVRYC